MRNQACQLHPALNSLAFFELAMWQSETGNLTRAVEGVQRCLEPTSGHGVCRHLITVMR